MRERAAEGRVRSWGRINRFEFILHTTRFEMKNSEMQNSYPGNMGRGVAMRKISGLFTLMTLVFMMFFLGEGCAYFNTFYLAKKNYNNGERFRKRDNEVRPDTKKYYEDAIKNASAILQDFKKSKYVDDSLYMIGMSYYYYRTPDSYVRARTKFDELLKAFPKSEYVNEARYYRARCFMEMNQTDNARIDLNELLANGNRAMRGRAGLVLAEIQSRAEQWDELVATADKIIASDPENDTLAESMWYRGDGLFQLEKYKDAVETFQKLPKKKMTPLMQSKVNIRIALGLARLGSYDEALKTLTVMQNKGEFARFAPNIRLETGKILELKGETDRAVEAYRTMAADFPDSTAGREAWYRVGIITLKDISKVKDARDAFDKVTQNKKIDQTWFIDAKAKVAQIDTMKARNDRIEKLKDDPIACAHERFLLAELLTYSLNHPDAALEQYKIILEEAPKSEYAVRSAFMASIAALDTNGASNDAAMKDVMRKVVEQYPDSHFSQELKVQLGILQAPPDIRMLRVAEDARLSDKGPDVYLPLYQAVADSFPESRSGYQARFVMAWGYEHEKADLEKAVDIYKKLAAETKNEANSDYVTLATDKLNMIMDEKKIIEESKKNIAFFESEMSLNGQTPVQASAPSETPEESGFSEQKKIRERNARIHSKYYSN